MFCLSAFFSFIPVAIQPSLLSLLRVGFLRVVRVRFRKNVDVLGIPTWDHAVSRLHQLTEIFFVRHIRDERAASFDKDIHLDEVALKLGGFDDAGDAVRLELRLLARHPPDVNAIASDRDGDRRADRRRRTERGVEEFSPRAP